MTKYGAVRTDVDGIVFASKAEARRYEELKLMLRAGEISQLEMQPRFPLIVNGVKVGNYTADFRFLDHATGDTRIEDVKGFRTQQYRLRKKLVEALYGITVVEIDA